MPGGMHTRNPFRDRGSRGRRASPAPERLHGLLCTPAEGSEAVGQEACYIHLGGKGRWEFLGECQISYLFWWRALVSSWTIDYQMLCLCDHSLGTSIAGRHHYLAFPFHIMLATQLLMMIWEESNTSRLA